jgi:hypothetical protein
MTSTDHVDAAAKSDRGADVRSWMAVDADNSEPRHSPLDGFIFDHAVVLLYSA